MALSAGQTVGSYEIVAALGAGGMGEVYRARDTKLKRDVALKILPVSVANDEERLARFQREAEVLASLNHPHIAAIYGLEEGTSEDAAVHAIIMELVDGETLADRISRGSLATIEAIKIATQIAEALQAAHDQGVVHRDLKPANIALTQDDQVKVLDFGLARIAEAPVSSKPPLAMDSPTFTSPLVTGMGTLLGTAAYMSPEQAKGRAADKRSDIWSFGCVFYEMLTGRRAFEGDDATDTLAAVLRAEPDWSLLPSDTPSSIVALLKQCMARDRKTRVADISVAEYLLRDPGATSPTPARQRWIAPAAAATIALLAVAMVTLWMRPFMSVPQASRVTFTIGGDGDRGIDTNGPARDLLLTPDGRRIIYKSVNADGNFVLMARAFDQLEPTTLVTFASTSFVDSLFVSPDSNWLGISSRGELRKVRLSGGALSTICKTGFGVRGATWGEDGTIVYGTADLASGLFSVDASGGDPRQLTTPDIPAGELDHVNPAFLPQQQAVLFTVYRGPGRPAEVQLLDLKTGERKPLIDTGSDAKYVRDGFLVYTVNNGLNAVRFDAARREVRGESIPVVEQVWTKAATGIAEYSVANDGTLAYVPGTIGTEGAPRSLVWVDRQGREERLDTPILPFAYGRLSPDGTRIAAAMRDQTNDLWVWDLTRGSSTRLTYSPALDTAPVWMPDGRHIVFASQDVGVSNLFIVPADGTEKPRQLAASRLPQVPTSVSADGKVLVFWGVGTTTSTDIGVHSLGDKIEPNMILKEAFTEQNGDLSPDARWLAYQSNESGRFEVYVRSFPDVAAGRWTISTNGGMMPAWSRNGRELFYFGGDAALMRVAIDTTRGFTAARPEKLFEPKYFAGGQGVSSRTFDVSPDGQRFLMIKDADASGRRVTPSIVVVLNWRSELEARLPK